MCANTEEFDISFGRNIQKMNLVIKQNGRCCHFTLGFHQRIPILNIIKIRKHNNVFLHSKFGVKFKIPEQFEVRESLLSFGAESFIFQFAIQKIKIKTHRIVILPLVLYGCKVWFLILREEHRLRVFKRC